MIMKRMASGLGQECLIMLVNDGRLALVKRGSLQTSSTPGGHASHARNGLLALLRCRPSSAFAFCP